MKFYNTHLSHTMIRQKSRVKSDEAESPIVSQEVRADFRFRPSTKKPTICVLTSAMNEQMEENLEI